MPSGGGIPFVMVPDRALAGSYCYQTGVHTVLAAADSGGAARWWFVNPIGSPRTCRIKRIKFRSQIGSALLTPTSPRIRIQYFTFTGTPTGSVTLGTVSRPTVDSAPNGSCRMAVTGMTITPDGALDCFFPTASHTAVGESDGTVDEYVPASGELLLIPGTGILCDQPDAGTASDTRRYLTTIETEEF